MGSHRIPGHDISGAGMPRGFLPNATFPEWLSYPSKMNAKNSPSSPLSTQILDHGMAVTSRGQDLHASAEANSGRCLSHSSSRETGNSSSSNSPVFTPELLRMALPVLGEAPIQAQRHMLEEIETILMAPDAEEATTSDCQKTEFVVQPECSRSRLRPWELELSLDCPVIQKQYMSNKYQKTCCSPGREKHPREMADFKAVDVRGLLIGCAEAISENRVSDFEMLASKAEAAVSISGEPMQRLGAYLLEGLKARQEASGTTIYRSLRCTDSDGSMLLSHMQILYDICPYFKFGYMAANGAIAEAIRNEDRVHIIDFQIAQGTQWLTLIQALAARPGGPPHVRITGIDDPVSRHARGDSLEGVGGRLTALSKRFNIPVDFHAMPVFAANITRDMLDIRPGEAVAVNFALQLHHTPDESVDVNNPRDGLLRMVKSLSPKVTTLVEQESNMNTTPFLTRFMEALDYYHAMFESIDDTLPRDNRERINLEQHCLAKDIVNIIACEGKERIERHELLGKWKSRLGMAGFEPYPLSSYVNSVIRSLLRCYSDKYTLVEKDGAMLLGWKNRHLISASAWR